MTKKLLTQILVVLAGFLILPQAMQAEDVTNWSQIVTDYGPATEGDYADDGHLVIEGTDITILSAKGLAWLAKETNKGSGGAFNRFTGYTITLGKDINLAEETDGVSGLEWTPIGNSNVSFQGHFDGAGHTISEVYIKYKAHTLWPFRAGSR